MKVSLKVLTKKELLSNSIEEIGGLSMPSKMPWYSYSIPPKFCITGSKLVDIINSVCYGCYATKNTYLYPNTVNAMDRRYAKIGDPNWVSYFSNLLNSLAEREKDKNKLYFRWHDAGDIQSVEHLSKIVEIANNCPTIKFWIPTREYSIVQEWYSIKGNFIPSNLTIRLSAHMVGRIIAPTRGIFRDLPNSCVVEKGSYSLNLGIHYCPSSQQEGKCLDCRACWNPKIKTVAYTKH